MSSVYFHIDLNAFFANAEILRDPSLRGFPIAVSGNTRRSVVATASYEARAFGVHSAMPLEEAKKLCPDLIIVEPHFAWYETLSQQFIEIVKDHSDEIEQASIDECYADVTNEITKYEKPLDLAWFIQKHIHESIGLPCSIGIAPNMFLAKMASDMKKPMGITVLRIREIEQKLWPLPIGDMRGIGNKTVPLLEALGIHTIGDLANYHDIEKLQTVLGKNTDAILKHAHGHDDRIIIKDWDAKSMGVSETMLEDITDYDEIKGLFHSLSRKLSKKLLDERKLGRLISIRVKYYDFQNTDRSHRLDHSIWKSDDLFVQAISLFDENWTGDPVRLIGISISDFEDQNHTGDQVNLFDERIARQEETVNLLKELNSQFGSEILHRASKTKKVTK